MLVAVLDLGTNTFHLLIADIAKGQRPRVIYQETIAVKLGEGGIEEGTISQEAFARGINALNIFKDRIYEYHEVAVKSAATSAIRSASNGVDFINKAQAATGLEIEVIDGEREAELIYLGVRAAISMEDVSLIVDIGGGSVELIICNKHEIFWQKSYLIGAARLMSRFHRHDPISDSDVAELLSYLDETLEELHVQMLRFKPKFLIGSAGSFETFAEMQDPDFKPSFDKPETEIKMSSFERIADLIIKSTHQQRERMKDLSPVRVDMIVVSTILAKYIIDLSGVDMIKLSTYSLKEGLLWEQAHNSPC